MVATPRKEPQQSAELCALEHGASATLANTQAAALHLPGARDQHRRDLKRAIELAQRVVDRGNQEYGSREIVKGALFTLVGAYAARAQDARHGASQLSQSAQRAPTVDECEDGWRRVEGIVVVAEESAQAAVQIAKELETTAAWGCAEMAQSAAREARRLVEQRNCAYTFHADPGFSFGEGWYLAAAATLAEVAIQVEQGAAQTAQANQFLRDAGLSQLLFPYRSRPRANKQLPDIVARVFRANPNLAQSRLRSAFLGKEPFPLALVDWADRSLADAPAGKRVLVWLRYGSHQPERNTSYPELVEVAQRIIAAKLVPILIGDALRGGEAPSGCVDMTLFWKLPIFRGRDMRRAQLQLFEYLKEVHGLVGQVGVTTAGMDGPALMGLPTMYLTQKPNVRLGTWVGAIPGYLEVVRDSTYLARISYVLKQWAQRS